VLITFCSTKILVFHSNIVDKSKAVIKTVIYNQEYCWILCTKPILDTRDSTIKRQMLIKILFTL